MQDPNQTGSNRKAGIDVALDDPTLDNRRLDDRRLDGFRLDDMGPDDLARQDFAYRLAGLRQAFQNRFGRPLTITGTDTAEHVRLHGRGLAADIRTHGLNPEHLDWLRDQTNALGLNGRDYSWLTRPVTTSTGVRLTGPHFHVDYGNHREYGAVLSHKALPSVGEGGQGRASQDPVTTTADDEQRQGGRTGASTITEEARRGMEDLRGLQTFGSAGAGRGMEDSRALLTFGSAGAGSAAPSTGYQVPATPRRRTVRRGNLASVTITPDSPDRVIDQNVAQTKSPAQIVAQAQSPVRVVENGVVQTQSHPTQVQATYRGDSIQIYASDLLDQLDGKRISPQQFYRAFQDRYAAGLGFSPAQQAAMREYYRSQGSSYDPFSFDASPADLIAQARNGRGFVTVGRSPEVIRNLEAFRHSAYIDPMTAQVRDATSPQAELDRATRALIDKGIDPASVHWEGELDPDSQLRIMADSSGAWPELQRYFDARSRLHPSASQQLTMDIGSAAARVGSTLVQTGSNLGTLLFSRGEPTGNLQMSSRL